MSSKSASVMAASEKVDRAFQIVDLLANSKKYGTELDPADVDPDDAEQFVNGLIDMARKITDAKTETNDPWEEHPDYTVSDWQYAVGNGDTRSGYWEWVANQTAQTEEGCEPS
ncbi:hypothetical protein [Pseudodesulfovibrio pelocollis]|uniref:hypothetical protein n=1 Tax=Pseudodesulfovibrio pelocollis TaxID=3051432 RepID=UPI00255A728B|nr:hypothetical protein [Pseudodesulfovibrio sp. SB368]